VVALSKYVWATTSYGGQPSVEVFAKYYCLHWQKRMIGSEVAQFGSCTFTPKTGKTMMQVVELVPCARNKWGNWQDFWFYVAEGIAEDHPGLPVSEMCSHFYSAYPPFEVADEDANEGALRCAAGLSSGRDLVEECVPSPDAFPRWEAGAKSCLRAGSAESRSGRLCARGGGWGGADRGSVCA
jgi:hypothetical protein